MNILNEQYPVPTHATWEVTDSTKLSCYMECPRKYFYQYVLGWNLKAENNHLVYGKAWHKAMEHLLLHGYDNQSILNAYDIFLAEYRPLFPEDTDILYDPKTPSNALQAMALYVQEYPNDHQEYKVLATEISAVIPITDEFKMHARMDSILEAIKNNKILSLEHKTGSRMDRSWSNKWFLSLQAGTYTHVLYCYTKDPELVKGVIINGVFFRKKGPGFLRVPVYKTPNQMQQWLNNTITWLDMLKYDFEALANTKESDELMLAFPQNTTSCSNYFGCPYLDFCGIWNNPIQKANDLPFDHLEVRFWDPREEEAKLVADFSKGEGE